MSAGPAPVAAARPREKPRFGAFARFREVFALVFAGRPGVFLGFGILALPGLPLLATAAEYGAAEVIGIDLESDTAAPWATAAIIVAFGLSAVLAAGVMVMAGCDHRNGRRRALPFYLGYTLRRLHIAAILGTAVLVLALIGSAVIGLLGLWVVAVFSVVLPVLLWEDARWGAMGRSQDLTREYRWPIAGLFLMVKLVPIALYAGAVIVGSPLGGSAWGTVSAVLGAVAMLLIVPLLAAASAVTHARLRAIKGGGEARDLGDVFA